METVQDNSCNQNLTIVNLPKGILQTFKSHHFVKGLAQGDSFSFIIDNDRFRRASTLQKEIELMTNRLYNLSNYSSIKNSFFQKPVNHSLNSYLAPDDSDLYDRSLSFIKEKEYPSHFSHYVLDFIASTNGKFSQSDVEDVFTNIATRFMLNTHSVLSGISSPKSKETVYNTLPRAFSPLFFQKVQFAGTILRNKKIRKEFDECLVYGLSEHIRVATYKILMCSDYRSLNEIIAQTIDCLHNSWWVPEQVLTKIKQTGMYIKNSFSSTYSNLIEFLVLSFILRECSFGLQQHKLKDINITKAIKEIKNYISRCTRISSEEPQEGWLIFDSIPQRNGFLYRALKELWANLNKSSNRKNRFSKPLGICKKYRLRKSKLVSGLLPNMFINIA